MRVGKRIVTEEVIRRFAVQSTKASAKLEGRAVPADHVRSPQVERYLAEHPPQA